MQINFHRFKKPIAFLCGLCLSLSVFYSRGLITYALPVEKTVTLSLSNVGMVNGDGSINNSGVRNYYTDMYDCSLFSGTTITLNPYTFSGTTTRNALNDCYRLYCYFYDEDRIMISNTNILGSPSWSGTSPNFTFTCTINGTFNVPSNAKYIRFSMRNWTGTSVQPNYDVIYNTPLDVSFKYTYDDGSFNVGIYGVGAVRFPLNVSGSYKDYNNEFPYYGSDSLLTGSANSLQNSYITLSGFDKAYYDLDLYINIDITPKSKDLNDPNVVITGQFDGSSLRNPLLQCSYPNVIVTSIPKELNYKIGASTIYGTAIQYEAKNNNTNGVNYIWDSTIKSKSSVELHIYGTTYISDEFTIGLLYDALVNCRNFPQSSYNNVNQILDFSLDYSVSGIVQKSPHTFGSEIEGLESIDESINNQTNEMIKEHEEEIQKGQETSDELSSSLNNVTSTLTAVEILKLPWTMLTDLYNAIIKDGQTSLIFPSFELMGYTLWESYEFDLNTLDSNFPVLFKSLRLITGIIICSAFGMYIRNYFTRLFGGDMEVD